VRVLITGGTGFLGRALCRRLAAEGEQVRALVRPGTDASLFEELGIDIRRGDLRNAWSLADIARGIDTIIHAGAMHRGGRLRRTDFWQANSEGTRHLLQEAVHSGVRRFVYLSTAGVHGDTAGRLAVETDAPHPGDLYQITKFQGEQAVRRIAHSDGLDAVILRPGALYGAGEPRFAKLYRPIARRQFVMIGSWKNRIHFLHRDDAVEAVLTASRHAAASGETFLVAGPGPTTMRELVGSIATSLDVPPPSFRVPISPLRALAVGIHAVCRPLRIDPPLYPRRLAFFGTDRAYRTDKIRTRLGFKPRRELDEGLREMAAWYRDQGLL
jgi:nucleoside-diphosphate-sugar epimerase